LFNFAICEDDLECNSKIYNIVNDNFLKWNAKFEIQQFDSGKDMLENISETMFDLIFLDIDLDQICGFDVADKLKAINKDMDIIFVSNTQDMIGRAIHYSPFRFIEKVNMDNDIPEAIEAYIKKISNEILLIESDIINRQPIKIRIKDILYLESIRHNIKVIYIKRYSGEKNIQGFGQYNKAEFRGSLTVYEKRWAMFGFVRASKSYLVNVKYMKKVKREGIILDNNDIVAVSRGELEQVKEEYNKYVRKYSYAK